MAHPHHFDEDVNMKHKRATPVKPRNRESKNRVASLSQIKECRHIWMDGYCIKCGCEQPGEIEAKEPRK
jgi:hypothetical protein